MTKTNIEFQENFIPFCQNNVLSDDNFIDWHEKL